MSQAELYYARIKKKFSEAGDPSFAQERIKYMRYKFDYYGLRAPVWVNIIKNDVQNRRIACR